MDDRLRGRRGELELAWHAGVVARQPAAGTRPDVAASWARSSAAVTPGLQSAPVVAPDEVCRRWTESRLGRASRVILDDLADLAGDGDMVAAITDEHVTIAWMAGGRTMRQRAERVHFTTGGCWAEEAVGTNALAVAQHTGRAATVFSAEHYAAMVHDWVCYSAPILDPGTGRFLGVLDLSTLWSRAHHSLLTTVSALARCVEYELAAAGRAADARAGGSLASDRRAGVPGAAFPGGDPIIGADGGVGPWPPAPLPGLTLCTLGRPAVLVDGLPVAVTRRQIELLAVLSLHPGGLGLDELVGRVYGDRPVSPSTVKAELSHLRHALGGRIGSRPYRLVGPVYADHRVVLQALGSADLDAAVAAYRGPMLAMSDSPDVTGWRHHIDVAVRDAVLRSGRSELLWELSGRCPDDVAVHQAALAALDRADARRSVVAGRLAAATA